MMLNCGIQCFLLFSYLFLETMPKIYSVNGKYKLLTCTCKGTYNVTSGS